MGGSTSVWGLPVGSKKTLKLSSLSAPSVHNVQFLSSPLPSSPRWVSISRLSEYGSLSLRIVQLKQQPHDWVWGRVQGVGEGRSQCVHVCTCVCERVRTLRALKRSRP